MRSLPRHEFSFTLIELIVVIAIIIILAGLLIPAYQAAQNQARKAQAKNDLTQIVTAVNAFYTEYGRYPVNPTLWGCATTGDISFSWDDPPATRCDYNDKVLNELRACTATDTSCSAVATLNTRQVAYLSPPLVKDPNNPRSGITTIAANTPKGTYYDPWKSPYNLVIDNSYDNHVPNPYGNTGGAGVNPLPQGVIAWSNGADQLLGGNPEGTYTNSDDVISWQ